MLHSEYKIIRIGFHQFIIIFCNIVLVPVSAAVSLITNNPAVGSPLQIDCITEGPPDTKVTWQFGNAQLIVDERRRILSNHTLFITKADISDSGEYKCTAQYTNNVATSAVYVEVKCK